MATQRTALMPAIQTRRLLQKGGGAAGAHEKRLKKCRALPTSLLREGKSSALRNVGACLFLKSCGDQPGFRQWAAGVFLARREVSIGIQAGSRANKPSLIIWPWTNSKKPRLHRESSDIPGMLSAPASQCYKVTYATSPFKFSNAFSWLLATRGAIVVTARP